MSRARVRPRPTWCRATRSHYLGRVQSLLSMPLFPPRLRRETRIQESVFETMPTYARGLSSLRRTLRVSKTHGLIRFFCSRLFIAYLHFLENWPALRWFFSYYFSCFFFFFFVKFKSLASVRLEFLLTAIVLLFLVLFSIERSQARALISLRIRCFIFPFVFLDYSAKYLEFFFESANSMTVYKYFVSVQFL